MTHQHVTSSKLFATLGFILHHFTLRYVAHSGSLKRHPMLQEFESRLAEKLEALKSAGDELGFLSIHWLLQAMTVVLATHSNVKALIPNLVSPLSDRDNKWVEEYLDDSAKLLDVCNGLSVGISEVDHYKMHVQIALRYLDLKDCKLYRARSALHDCLGGIKKKDTEYRQGLPKSKLESCSSMLRVMGKKLVNPKGVEATKGNGFLNHAIYGAKVTTIFLCGLLVTALACKPKRPLVNLHVASHYLWSPSLVSLQVAVKEVTDKRKNKGSIALLRELDNVDLLVRRLHELIDRKLNEKCSLPLDKVEGEEIKQLAEELSSEFENLGRGLAPLEECVNELFRMLIASRHALLDLYLKRPKKSIVQ